MAKEVGIKIKLDSADAAKSIGDIRKSIKDLNNAALEIGEGGKGFSELTKKAAELKDKLGDLKDATNIQGTGIEKLKTSFGLLTDSFKNADFGKLKTSLQGIGSAMKAIPLILIIEGIQYLIENFDKLSKGNGLLAKTLRFVGDTIQFVIDAMYELTDALGLTNHALDKQGETIVKNAEKSKVALEGQTKEYDNQIAAAKAAGESTIKFELAKQDAIILTNQALLKQTLAYLKAGGALDEEQQKVVTEQLNQIKDAEAQKVIIKNGFQKNELDKQKKHNEDIAKENKEASDKAKKKREDDWTEEQAVREQLNNDRIDANKFVADSEAAENKKAQDSKNKIADKEYDDLKSQIDEANNLIKNTSAQKIRDLEDANTKIVDNVRLSEEQKKELIETNEKEIANLRSKGTQDAVQNIQKMVSGYAQLTQDVVGVFQAIADLRQQQREQELRKQEEANDASLTLLENQKNKELSKEGLSAQQKQKIEAKYAQLEYQLKLDQYNKETEVKKKSFETDKKFKIVSTIISTITGSLQAFIGVASSFGWTIPGIIAGAVAGAAVTVAGVINVAKLKQQTFDAGTPPQPPQVNLGGGGSSNPEPQSAPTLGGTKPQQLQQVGGQNSNTNNEPIRAYVVTEDVTASQDKNAMIERRASFL